MSKRDIGLVSSNVMALADLKAQQKKQALAENFTTASGLPEGVRYPVESRAIKMLGFLFRCLLGKHLGDDSNHIEVAYDFDEDGKYHSFEIYPDFSVTDEEFVALPSKLKEASMRIEEKIEAFLEELDLCSVYEEGAVRPEDGVVFFNTKMDLYKLIWRYLIETGVKVKALDELNVGHAEMIIGGYMVDQRQIKNEAEGIFNARVKARREKIPNYDERLLLNSPQRPYFSKRQYISQAYLSTFVNNTQDMMLAMYFDFIEAQIKLEDGLPLHRDLCHDRNLKLVSPAVN